MLIQLSDLAVPSSLRGPVLIDELGLPRYWSVVWSTASAAHPADSTHLKKLRYIENLYQFADQLLGRSALDDALGTLNDDALATILESWFVSILNQSRTSASDELRWQTGLGFVSSIVTWIAKSQSGQLMRHIDARLQQLSMLYGQLHVNKTKPTRSPTSKALNPRANR